MKRELSGGITSKKRFAGKSDFSAKQVSTTLLLLLLCVFMPSSVKGAGNWNGMTVTFDFTQNTNYSLSSSSFKSINRQAIYMMTDSYYNGFIGLQNATWQNNGGLYQANGTRYISLQNINSGDKLKIVWERSQGENNMKFVDDGNVINSNEEYDIQGNQGYVDIEWGRYIRVKQIIITYSSARTIWSGTQSGTKTINGETLPLFRYRLSSRSFEEPVPTVIPGGKTISYYTIDNLGLINSNGQSVGGQTVAIMDQNKWNNDHVFDMLFINQGYCKVTVHFSDNSTEAYFVEAWDNDAYYVIENDGTKYRLAKNPDITQDSEQGGVIKNRTVTGVGGMEMQFGNVDKNTTVVYLNGGHMVSFTNADNGWWDRYPYVVDWPTDGTYYIFKATARGKLKFGGIKSQTGGRVYLVNSVTFAQTDVFAENTSGYLESGEIDMNPGQIYYMHGEADQSANKWAVFQLEWFSFETGIKLSESFGVSALTGYEIGSNSITSKATIVDTYGGTLEVEEVEYKGTVTGATVTLDGSGHIVFSNIQFSTSEKDKMGGAIKVKIGEGSSYKEFVMTIPYGKHVWDFRNTSTYMDSNIGTGGTDGVTYTSEELVADMKANTDDWSRVYKVHRRENGVWTELKTAILAARGTVAGNNAFYMSNTAGLIVMASAESFGAHEDVNSTEGYNNLTLDQQYYLDESTVAGADQMWIHNVGAKILFPGVKPGQYIKVYCRRHAPNKGTIYTAENLWDLKDTPITSNFDVTGIQADNRKLVGVLIFKVPTDYVPTDDISKIPALVLKDDGWTRFAQVEITDVYSTDQVTNKDSWIVDDEDALTGGSVIYPVNSNANVVYKESAEIQVNDYVKTLTQAAWHPEITILNPDNITYTTENVQDEGSNMNHLKINITDGQGNLCIIQDMVTGGYTLDRIETWIPVSKYHTQTYPYTWDFTAHNMTDPWTTGKKAADSDTTNPYLRLNGTFDGETNTYGMWKNGKMVTFAGEDYNVNLYDQYDASEETHKKAQVIRPLFADGGELTYGNVTLKETEGLLIGIPRVGLDKEAVVSDIEENGKYAAYNGTIEFPSTGGLKITAPAAIDDLDRNNIKTSISIPEVDENMYIFVKASAKPTVANAEEVTDKYDVADGVYLFKKNTSKDTKAILQFSSALIEKIAVTDIEKSINDLGYATESRAHAIDHTYTGEFTKNDVNAYAITTYTAEGDVYDYKGYPEVRKSENEVTVVPANTGIVLYKSGNSAKFTAPLFYPARNVVPSADDVATLANNWMAPNVESKRHYSEVIQKSAAMGGTDETWCTKFIMTRKYYTYNKTSESFSGQKTSDVEAFYRMIIDQNEATAAKNNTIGANKAYLLIPSDKLPKALWNGGSGAGKPGEAKNVIFIDLEGVENADVDSNGETTAIDNAIVDDAANSMEQKVYFSIDGTRIEGKPTNKGVYICNGKKVYVK